MLDYKLPVGRLLFGLRLDRLLLGLRLRYFPPIHELATLGRQGIGLGRIVQEQLSLAFV